MTLSRGRFAGGVAAAGLATALPNAARAQALIPVKGAITPVYYDAIPILYAQQTGMFAKGRDRSRSRPAADGRRGNGRGCRRQPQRRQVDVLRGRRRVRARRPDHRDRAGRVYDSRSPNGALVVAKDSPIRSVADMSGKVIAVNNLSEPTRPAMEAGSQQTALRKTRSSTSRSRCRRARRRRHTPDRRDDSHRPDHRRGAWRPESIACVAPVMNAIAPRWLFSSFFATRDWAKEQRSRQTRCDRDRSPLGGIHERAPRRTRRANRRSRRRDRGIDRAHDVADRRHGASSRPRCSR